MVLPLHNPMRVAEDWAVIDQLSGGRVGLSFASGWHANDFAFMPDNYERRREVMSEYIDTVLKLWRGEKITVRNGSGEMIDVSVLPRPVQARPPIWIASAASADTFTFAGRIGANILTNMLGQDLADLKAKFEAYRAARREHGHEGDGIISVMLHTYVNDDTERARRVVRKPFSDYLASSFDLVKAAPKMFPAFRQPSRSSSQATIDQAEFTPDDMAALMEHAFNRYFETAGLFGTPERALAMVDQLAEIGATEVACLIDFGVDPDLVLESLPHLHRLQEMCRERAAASVQASDGAQAGFAELIRGRGVTHLQCTPSMARMLSSDPDSLQSLSRLEKLLLGGEALPPDLAERLSGTVRGETLNMYGPTETTVWSTAAVISGPGIPAIGRPIANTTIRILDEHRQLVPIGMAGELWIGGNGVCRGYLDRPDLTAERFVDDPWATGQRMYRTGDLARYRPDGQIEFLGRLDHQVKINGYRIELGEIEAALARHPAVRQAVVVARPPAHNGTGPTGAPALDAYVVLASNQTSTESSGERVRDWQTVWDETYQRSAVEHGVDPRFRIAGWTDSFTREPIPAAQMGEWLDATTERVLALSPRRVVEIGCGTGMILYRALPHVQHYTGMDISREALDAIRRELTDAEAAKVTLKLLPAHGLEGMPERSCDLVIINSVAQYFPDAEYFARVLTRASELVADAGRIFIGDVRDLGSLATFHTAVELAHAPAHLDGAALRARVDRRVAHETELVVGEGFFHALVRDVPRLRSVEVELKRGRARNELTCFRYDVVLHVGPKTTPQVVSNIAPVRAETLDAIRAQLASDPESLYLADVPNARLTGVAAAERDLHAATPATAGSLRASMAAANERGVDPESVYTLDANYEAHLRFAHSGDIARFDAVLRRKGLGAPERWPFEPPLAYTGSPAAYANTPARANDDGTLSARLSAHLRESLPEYMIPATIIALDALPLTPNGKIDRQALLKVERTPTPASAPYAPPTGDLEQEISRIWQELLAIDRVGRHENIFDLGANSLLTMQANNRLAVVLGRKVPLVSMFRFPTVESLAAHLGEGDASGQAQTAKRSKDRASRAEQAAQRRRALRAERKQP